MTDALSARDALEVVRGHEAWAVIRRKAASTAGLVGGSRREVASLLDIPLEEGPPEPGRYADRLVAVPFRQVRERGFEAVDDGTPLVVVDVEAEHEVRVDDLLDALPDVPVELADRGGFETDDATYGEVVDRIIREEIGQGEGANLVIGRHYRAVIADWDADRALTVYRRLLERERGAYWTFCFFTGDRYLIGASPERHVSVRGGDVRMNPISGTFRVGREARRPRGAARPAAGVPRRREGDLRALHGRRRGAEDDVRHLPRGWPGARTVPQADDPPRPHRVPPRRPQRPRPARDPARHDVRRHRDRLARRERLPADRGVRDRGPGLLRRRARAVRPRPRGRPDDGQPDPDPHRRRRAGRPAQGDRRRDAGAGLGRVVRGGGDPRQGQRRARRLRAGAAQRRPGPRRRRARPRRGGADRARRPQPPRSPRSGSPTRRAPTPTRRCAASTCGSSTARTTS